MSDMKCPVCQNKLHKINIIVSTCTNDKCKLWGSYIPNLVLEALARTEQNLERTRKALDKAKWWLKEIVESHRCTPISTAEMALKEITALEQKEQQCRDIQ